MLFPFTNTEGYRLSSHLFPLFVWSQIEKATQIMVMSVDVNIAMLFTHYVVCQTREGYCGY